MPDTFKKQQTTNKFIKKHMIKFMLCLCYAEEVQ